MRARQITATLNDLIRWARDEEALSRACAAAAEALRLRDFFRRSSEACARQGDELQALVVSLGGLPATRGTIGETLRRAGIAARAALADRDDLGLLEAWACSQIRVLGRYEAALDTGLPPGARRLVAQHLDREAERHAWVARLRSECALQSRGPEP